MDFANQGKATEVLPRILRMPDCDNFEFLFALHIEWANVKSAFGLEIFNAENLFRVALSNRTRATCAFMVTVYGSI